MRHLLSPKVAILLPLLLIFTMLPAASARAEDGSTIASEVSQLVADLLAAIFQSADDSAPQYFPGGGSNGESLVEPGGEAEAAPQIIVGG